MANKAYERKKARATANKAGEATYTVDGTTRDSRTGKVVSGSTSSSPSGLNAAQIGGASGIGFETPENQAQISDAISTTIRAGGSKSQAGDAFGIAARRAAELKDRKERREKLGADGRLASDNLRASNLNLTGDEAITTKGAKSTTSGRDDLITEDVRLTDAQILDLEKQGYKEGDFVPGKGFLTPLGTFRSPVDTKADELSTAANKLAAKDKAPTDGITVSDESVVLDEKAAVDTINEAFKVNRDLTYIDDEIERIGKELNQEIEAINAQAAVDKASLQGQQKSETGQTSVGLANAGGYLGFSGSATGVLLNLAKTHRSELQELDARRQRAIFEAQDAARNSQFDLVKLKAQELKDIEQEEYERKQDYFDRTRAINEKEAARKEKAKVENDIYTALQGGARTVADIFAQLGGEVDAKTINDFLENITPEGSEGFKFSASQNASLLGTGMSMDDIRATSEYISANGYDETIKKALTPAQRAAVDKIFKSGAIGTGTGSNFTSQEQRKLEQAGLLTAPRQEQLDYLYGDDDNEKPYESVYTGQILDNSTTLDSLPLEVQDDVRNELLDLGFGSDVVPQWYRDYTEASTMQTPTAESLKSNWSSYRKKSLGEAEETEDKPWWKFGN